MLRPLGPVVFESFRPGALVDAPMGRLIGFVRHHPLGVLQVHHSPSGDGLFRGDHIFKELAQLPVIRHVAAKNQPAVFVNHEQRVGPNAISAVNPAIEMIDEDRKTDIFQPLQLTGIREFLFEARVRAVILRRMGLARIKQEKRIRLERRSQFAVD